MRLSKEAERAVKRPLGTLFKGAIPMPYKRLVREYGQCPVVAIGDVVSRQLALVGITPILSVCDGKTKRDTYSHCPFSRDDADYVVSNPKGRVSKQMWDTIKSTDFRNRKLFIDGEEDLATLPAILFAPIGAIVVYGQPDEGIVIVTVTQEKKEEIYSIIAMMEGEKWI